MKKYGPELLFKRAAEDIIAEWEWQIGEAWGETPIEKLLFFALKIRCDLGLSGFQLWHARDDLFEQKLLNGESDWPPGAVPMIVRPQKQIGDRVVDFFIHTHSLEGWHSLIVECDGHNYHERTKEQAARDRAKDRIATLKGYDFFRFTGSEIWRDAWGCATEICEWGQSHWARRNYTLA